MSALPLVLFDIDETLVHTAVGCDAAAPTTFDTFGVMVDDSGKPSPCYVRTHALAVLRYMVVRVRRGELRLGFWSTGTRKYVSAVVLHLFRLARIPGAVRHVSVLLTREQTPTLPCGTYVKKLENLFAETVILVDDNPVHADHPGNAGKVVRVFPFYGEHADDTLISVLVALRLRLALPSLDAETATRLATERALQVRAVAEVPLDSGVPTAAAAAQAAVVGQAIELPASGPPKALPMALTKGPPASVVKEAKASAAERAPQAPPKRRVVVESCATVPVVHFGLRRPSLEASLPPASPSLSASLPFSARLASSPFSARLASSPLSSGRNCTSSFRMRASRGSSPPPPVRRRSVSKKAHGTTA